MPVFVPNSRKKIPNKRNQIGRVCNVANESPYRASGKLGKIFWPSMKFIFELKIQEMRAQCTNLDTQKKKNHFSLKITIWNPLAKWDPVEHSKGCVPIQKQRARVWLLGTLFSETFLISMTDHWIPINLRS